MNVLSKLFVDTRENILSVCLAVLHILQLDRLVRLGSSAAKRLLPSRLWPNGGNAKVIQVETDYDDEGFDAQLPLSPVHIDHDGVETYEAVSVPPSTREAFDGEGGATFDDRVSTRDELSDMVKDDRDYAPVMPESSGPPHVDFNERSTGLLPLPSEEAPIEDDETFRDETSAVSVPEKLEIPDAIAEEPHKHLPVPLPMKDQRNGAVEPASETLLDVEMAVDQEEQPPTEDRQNGNVETVETSVGPVSAGLDDEPPPQEPAHEQPKKTSELLPTISSVGGKAYAPIRREPAVHEFKIPGIYIGDLVESKSPWATSSRNLLAKPANRPDENGEKMKKSTTSSADAVEDAMPPLLTPVVKPMLESAETRPATAVESTEKMEKIPEGSDRGDLRLSKPTQDSEAMETVNRPVGTGSREASKAPLEESSGLALAMQTPLPDEIPDSEDTNPVVVGSRGEGPPRETLEESSGLALAMKTPLPDDNGDSVVDDTAKEGDVRGEEPPRETLEESSGLAVAMAEDKAVNKQQDKSPFLARWEEGRDSEPLEMPRTQLKHEIEEPQLQEEAPQRTPGQLSRQELTRESEEEDTPTRPAVESSLKRKEATPLLEESSGLAVAMESPLKKRKDEDEPEHDPPTKPTEDVPPLRHTHEMVDLLAAARGAHQIMKDEPSESLPEQPSVSFADPLSMSSSPEAYAMSLISPSSSALRTTFLAPTKHADSSSSPRKDLLGSWKPEEEVQREKRVSVQTNDTEDADNDRHWEESEANDRDADEQPVVAKLATQTLRAGGGLGGVAVPALRAESEISETDGQSVVSTSEDEPWNSEDEEIFNAAPPFLGQYVSSAVYHTV